MSVLLIDVYADIVCPWCFIGFRRLNAAVQSTGRAEDVSIHHRPFMIHPDAPPEGIDLWAMLERTALNPCGMPCGEEFGVSRYSCSTTAISLRVLNRKRFCVVLSCAQSQSLDER